MDRGSGTLFQVALDFGVPVSTDFPFFIAFLNCDDIIGQINRRDLGLTSAAFQETSGENESKCEYE